MQTHEFQSLLSGQILSYIIVCVITIMLRKSSDVAFCITVSELSFCSVLFADSLQDNKISYALYHIGACHATSRYNLATDNVPKGGQALI